VDSEQIKTGSRKKHMNLPQLPEDYPDFDEHGTPPCAETDPDAFFADEPPPGSMAHRGRYTYEREAKKVCFSCPYQQACLAYAMNHPEELGIWGGTTEKQRKNARKGIPLRLVISPSRHR
jgi:WhiB family redox-sensing transcriptional regulator